MGIDVGTTAAKATVIDLELGVVGRGRHEYRLKTPRPGWVELDPEEYWRGVGCATRAAVNAAGGPEDIAALALSSQGETLVTINRKGRPARPAIVWLDTRATREAHVLEALHGDQVYPTTGQPQLTATWPACKILWLRGNEPRTFAEAGRFLLLEDYLVSRLAGEPVASRCLHSSSLLLDISSGSWWDAMLASIDISHAELPRLADSGEPIGTLCAPSAAQLGLNANVLVVAGGLDQVVAASAAGMKSGVAIDSTGSALAVAAETKQASFEPEGRIPCHISARPGAFCLLAWSQTAGMALQWTRDAIFSGTDFSDIDRAAAHVPAGCEGLLALPHFEGTSCPDWNPAARAAFVGLTLRHGRDHLARAVMEAVAFELRAALELIEGIVGRASEIHSLGGGARSDLWLQIKADVLQRPIVALSETEFACIGAATLAGIGANVFTDLRAAFEALAVPQRHIEPQTANAALYEQHYHDYQQLYAALMPLFLKEAVSV
jgi:xylulokinase